MSRKQKAPGPSLNWSWCHELAPLYWESAWWIQTIWFYNRPFHPSRRHLTYNRKRVMHFYSNTQNSLPRAFWSYNYTAVLGTRSGALCLLGNFLQLNDYPNILVLLRERILCCGLDCIWTHSYPPAQAPDCWITGVYHRHQAWALHLNDITECDQNQSILDLVFF